jgi:homoserine dehydrogenase
MTTQKLVLAGFGNIGQAVAELIAAGHSAASGLTITGVCDPRFGTVADPAGLDPGLLLGSARDHGTFEGLSGLVRDGDVFAAIDRSGGDTLVELTFTDLETGEPATSHVRYALSRGLNVSTTNKGPIALHLDELEKMAADNQVVISYEGTVMSGTPTVLVAAESIKGAGFRGATGILNGTSNFIITRMEMGVSYEEALAEAQDRGYAEADPSGDVDGHDAAGKLSILARVLADTIIAPSEIEQVSLRTLSSDDVRSSAAGKRWRYVGVLKPDGPGWSGVVAPRLFESDHPLASVTGATNAITFSTELLGDVTLSGPGAGRVETAYSVLNDLARIAATRSR